jgi:alanyl-tRNA synthetase
MGGQVGDTGEMSSPKGKVTIVNTVRSPSDMVLHHGRVVVSISLATILPPIFFKLL